MITLILLLTSLATVLFCLQKMHALRIELQAEKSRRELLSKKAIFEKLLDAISDPVFVKDGNSRYLYGNRAYSEMMDKDQKDYIGKTDTDFFPKEMADIFLAKDKETLEKQEIVENEELILFGKEVRTAITKKTPVRGIEGGTAIIGVIRDITDRKQQEETILSLYRLIESSSDLYCFCDLKGKPLFVNQHGNHLGLNNSFEHFRQFFGPSENIESIIDILKEKQSWEGEIEVRDLKNSTTIPYWMKIFYVFDDKRTPRNISFVGTDIKERKEAESKLFYTSKMASLGEMAGGIAHEINNPLAIISGKAEQLQKLITKENFEKDKALQNLQKIEETTFRISRIIKGLRSFSRADQQDPMVEVSLKEMIEETLDLCRERLKNENITLIQHVDSSLKVLCRPTEIQHVIINLLNNSTDAIKHQESPWIKISTSTTNSSTCITVADSGKGIEDKFKEKIMDPFFTTKGVGEGTGLGLPISRRIMESNNGHLLYNSSEKNTSFSLCFNT